ncbi:MAG TPA: nucleoside deaminase, partial [Pseudomonadales bacterium]|nr:nucleoside deaminase [Pseudomonadales bacterium]
AGCSIYTSCEPCPMCLAAIYWARLDQVYYAATRNDAAAIGFDDAHIYQELKLPFAQRHIPFTQLMRDQALIPFSHWQNKTDKTPY